MACLLRRFAGPPSTVALAVDPDRRDMVLLREIKMSVQIIGAIEGILEDLIITALAQIGGGANASDHDLVLVHGATGIDTADARAALAAGKTVATVHAKKGHLADVSPGAGIDVPADLLLHAVTRVPIDGHPGMYHTIVTMVPEGDATPARAGVVDELGTATGLPAFTSSVPYTAIADTLRGHVSLLGDPTPSSPNEPPPGTMFGILTYYLQQQQEIDLSSWVEAGTKQTWSVNMMQQYFVYYANGSSQQYEYVVMLVQNGTVNACQMDASNNLQMCTNSDGARAYALSTFTNTTTVQSGALTLTQSSPLSGTTDPVSCTVSQVMSVQVPGDGGPVPQQFVAGISVSAPNPNWGVQSTSNLGTGEIGWVYYNNNNWNGLTNTTDTFGNWWSQMYDDDDNVLGIDGNACNGAAFYNAAIYTIPANPGDTSLPVQFGFDQHNMLFGFCNRGNSGVWHHQLTWTDFDVTIPLPQWDLVQVAHSAALSEAL